MLSAPGRLEPGIYSPAKRCSENPRRRRLQEQACVCSQCSASESKDKAAVRNQSNPEPLAVAGVEWIGASLWWGEGERQSRRRKRFLKGKSGSSSSSCCSYSSLSPFQALP